MHPKIKLYQELRVIVNTILDEIVGPTCGISGIVADPWLCDLEVYIMEDDKLREQVMMQIQEKYKLTDDQMIYIDAYTPLLQIALLIYLQDLEGIPADG